MSHVNALSLYNLSALHVYVDAYLLNIIKQPKETSTECIRYRLYCSEYRVLKLCDLSIIQVSYQIYVPIYT